MRKHLELQNIVRKQQRKLVSDVQRYGYHKVGVFSALFGLPSDTAFTILDGVMNLIEEGTCFTDSSRSSAVLNGVDVVFRSVMKSCYSEYFGQALALYGSSNFPMFSLVRPDQSGNFPWDENAPDWLKLRQPRIWTNAR